MGFDAIEWLLNIKVGDSVAIYNRGTLMYTEIVKAKFPDCILLNNDVQFDEYGDEIDLEYSELEGNKQYIGPVKEI